MEGKINMFLNVDGFINCSGESVDYTIEEKDQRTVLKEKLDKLETIISVNKKEIEKLIKQERSLPPIESSIDKHNEIAKKVNKLNGETNNYIDEYNSILHTLKCMNVKDLIEKDIKAVESELEKCITDKDNADQHRLNAFKLNCILEDHKRELSEKNIQYILNRFEDKIDEKLNELYRKLK